MEYQINLIKRLAGARVLVIGDLMLDHFVYGDVQRISPEGPVPVLAIEREETMLGGAGNVLSNLHGLGAKPYIISIVGDDAEAEDVARLMDRLGVDFSHVYRDFERPTIQKTRFVARSQQLLRADREKIVPLSPSAEQVLTERVKALLSSVQAIVLSDYGKGVLTPSLIEKVIALSSSRGIPVLVDPKGNDFSIYRGADVITPNRKELALASGMAVQDDSSVVAASQKIIKSCGIKCVIATRSEDGMSVILPGGAAHHIRARAKEVFDVSGAGDTVIAVLAAALAGGADVAEAAGLANIAGGIVVGKTGTTPIHASELEAALLPHAASPALAHPPRTSVRAWEQAAEQVRAWQAQGLKVGFTNGCFDILHYGHVNYLQDARDRCDRLIVGLNSDVSVRLLKGPSRPVNGEAARATVLSALSSVDMVVLFGASKAGEDNTPSALIQHLKPDLFFKGGDYTVENLPEAGIVTAYGGKVEIMAMHEGYSTTGTIEKLKGAKG